MNRTKENINTKTKRVLNDISLNMFNKEYNNLNIYELKTIYKNLNFKI